MKKRSALTILVGVIGVAGLAMAGGGSKQYNVTVTGSGNLDSATVKVFICTTSLCQSPTQIGSVSLSGTGTVTGTFSGPSTARGFSYSLIEVDGGNDSGYNSSQSSFPLGVPVSVGVDLKLTVSSGTTTTTGGKGK